MSTKKQSKQPTRKQLIETCQELDKGVECVRGFLEKAEAEMKHLSSDGTLSTEGETCLGCRLQGYAEHNHACMKVIIKENDKLEEENEKLKEDIEELKHQKNQLEDFFVPSAPEAFAMKKRNETLEEQIRLLGEEIKELKSQIPDKKGKKLSQKDKDALRQVYEICLENDDEGSDADVLSEPLTSLLKRLLK